MTTGLWNHQNLHKILQIHTPKYLSVPMYILIPPSLNFRAIIFHCEIFNTYPNMYRSSKRKCCNLYYLFFNSIFLLRIFLYIFTSEMYFSIHPLVDVFFFKISSFLKNLKKNTSTSECIGKYIAPWRCITKYVIVSIDFK